MGKSSSDEKSCASLPGNHSAFFPFDIYRYFFSCSLFIDWIRSYPYFLSRNKNYYASKIKKVLGWSLKAVGSVPVPVVYYWLYLQKDTCPYLSGNKVRVKKNCPNCDTGYGTCCDEKVSYPDLCRSGVLLGTGTVSVWIRITVLILSFLFGTPQKKCLVIFFKNH